ncbi:MAG: ClpXP protease specificity-enhancing factor SspB [Pseudomonadota bacterium]
MQKAMRSVMADALGVVAVDGLPADHHFYITFETAHPGVDIPDWLRETYPDEMTIVLQEWFADLTVTSDRFSVTLNFADKPQNLVIPLEAVRTFVDPSVRFGLKFDGHDPDDAPEVESPVVADEPDAAAPAEKVGTEGADVVSLDKFRKS